MRKVRNSMMWLSLLVLTIASGVLHADTLPSVRVGVLSFGTVNWEINTLKHHQLDKKRHINVEAVTLTNKNAAAVALQSGAVDVILTDIFWAIKQGSAYKFAPTHRLTGGIYVSESALEDGLAGVKTLGVAGGPNDKNLLLFKAYSQAVGLTMPQQTKFAAPPLLNEMLVQRQIDGVINFWHYNARLQTKGFKNLLSTQSMLNTLNIEQPVPLLGWVFSAEFARKSTSIVRAFLAASQEAKQRLAGSNAEWQRLRPLMRADSDSEFESLKKHYPTTLLSADAGMVNGDDIPGYEQAAEQLFELVKNLPGQTLFYSDASFPHAIFFSPDSSEPLTLTQTDE